MDQVQVFSPATIANVVCGFDVLGFALNAPGDHMLVRKIDETTVRIVHKDNFGLPTEPEKNVAGVTLLAMLDASDCDFGVEAEITKAIMPGSGIGSSAASAAGAAVAANRLLDNIFTAEQLIGFAMQGERLASGALHADNVAPAILGGFTLVRSNEPLDVISIDYPPLFVTIVHPQIEIKTSDARSVLKQQIALPTVVKQTANFGALITGLIKGDYRLIARSLEDHIIEPIRSLLIPEFDKVVRRSKDAGALGGGISGSGPSIFMLAETEAAARNVATEMAKIYDATGLKFKIYISSVNPTGVSFI
jgi:homoserine kinase